ncbi:apolipoprotein N-acyltransferase [Aestuariimicrobium sp. T2.26MG-19.2B]|uniref:apolipoprotein N-acyltransferase n=1 Tax=Aestuariimicrobium sp. T2.26MG-19.2B TaxID=3040679 RepID=UPI00247749BD|nr:apolipoprotein N-acyltransferase [Aestuariimicrobium sp. T2.26MG-19.2B]CAI9409560.1 Apolipoprotein N-acyltransferase [Aestuariimicrobium sp. T2.26MG-19.2B]
MTSDRLRAWQRVPLLVLAGVVTAGGFAPLQWWPLALLGPAAFFWLARGGLEPDGRVSLRVARAGVWRGFLFGLGFYGALVGWIGVLGWFVVPGLVGLMALHTGLVGLGVALVHRLRWWPVWTAACWSLGEWTAARYPFGGFAWGRLAWTTADQPLGGWLGFVGASGVSLLCALVAAAVAHRVERPRLRPSVSEAVVVAIVLAGLGLGRAPALPATGQRVAVGMVQGNVDGTAGPDSLGYARSVTNNHLSETIALMARARTGLDPRPQFVLWPENSTDIDPTVDADTREMITEAQQLSGLPMFIGIVRYGPGPDERQTSGLWWTQQGPGERYDKRNLVPFGEYIPFRDELLPRFPILQQVGAQGVPGTKPGVTSATVAGRTLRVGDIICFELAYDSSVHDVARLDPQLVVVQSNNSTYTFTGQPAQQFQITRVRAMEMRRDVVVATTGSFSGWIDPHGRVLDRTREATAAARTYDVPVRSGVSIGVLVGPWVESAAALVALLAMLTSLVLARRGGRHRVEGSTRNPGGYAGP